MIPTRTLRATVDISTGSMIITNRPPAFTGEADAMTVSISLLDGGAAYSPTGNVVARLYLYWPGTIDMSEAVELAISGSTLTGTLPDTLTAVPGCPLLVVQLTDIDTQDLIVAAASPIQITNVLGERIISTRPVTPSEIIYIGRSPYIDPTTGHWMQWDISAKTYVDTNVVAGGRGATINSVNGHWMLWDNINSQYVDSGYSAHPMSFTATAAALAPGSIPTANIGGTQEYPILNLGIPTGVQGPQGPQGIQGPKGDPGQDGTSAVVELGFYGFSFRVTDGDLWCDYGGLEAPAFRIDSNGDLIYVASD